ncbi:MAG TPA: flagellar export protein FliJ [Deltaproteobacteria bacterium]|nr:flagellar export protein FliJ [Deltaproteobacteria bacterium]
MRLFKFRLESLLRYREHLAEQTQLEVARIRSDILVCEDRIARLEMSYAHTAEELDQKMGSGIDVKQYKQFTHFLAGIESNIESENMQRRELLKRLEEKQKELKQRTTDKKTLENLKNQRREDYYQKMLKLDQKESDEMVILRQAGGVGA